MRDSTKRDDAENAKNAASQVGNRRYGDQSRSDNTRRRANNTKVTISDRNEASQDWSLRAVGTVIN
jgi:hypothetical protein